MTPKTNCRPILDRVIVKYDKFDNTSEGGIIIKDPAKHEYPNKTGIVLAVGPGNIDTKGNRISMTVSVGDSIIFSGGAGLKVPGEEMTLSITEDDVYVIT